MTDNELRILARNLKRRRVKYKSVHTSKKSQTEVLRQVINNQMELYCEWLNHTPAHHERLDYDSGTSHTKSNLDQTDDDRYKAIHKKEHQYNENSGSKRKYSEGKYYSPQKYSSKSKHKDLPKSREKSRYGHTKGEKKNY